MELNFNEQGLIPAIVQDANNGQVLMLAYMNRESLEKTLASGETWFWSRSRQELWHKGATSGNVQEVEEIRYDCDADALLVSVQPAGPACHTGETSCFFRVFGEEAAQLASPPTAALPSSPFPQTIQDSFSLESLYQVIADRQRNPTPGSYTASLFEAGLPRMAQKVGEEAAEVLVAALTQEDERLVEEVADLAYHTLVLMAARGLTPAEIIDELARRHKPHPASA